MDNMAWDVMVQEEVQYQLNDADKFDIIEIDILLHLQKYSNGTLMVKVIGLYVICYDTIKTEDLHSD